MTTVKQVVLICDKCQEEGAEEITIIRSTATTRVELCERHLDIPLTEALRLGETRGRTKGKRGRLRTSYDRLGGQ